MQIADKSALKTIDSENKEPIIISNQNLQLVVTGDICWMAYDAFMAEELKFDTSNYLPEVPTQNLQQSAEDSDSGTEHSDSENSKQKRGLYHVLGYVDGVGVHAVNTGLRCVNYHELSIIFEDNEAIGSNLVMHCPDFKLATGIAKAMESFNGNKKVRYTEEQKNIIKARQNSTDMKVRAKTYTLKPSYTPYSVALRNQDKDDQQISQMKYFVRSLRAFFRSRVNLPLSKEKGVQCHMLIHYCIVIGLIERFFDDEFLKILQTKLQELSEFKLKNINKDTPLSLSKLKDFHQSILFYLSNKASGGDTFLGLNVAGIQEMLSFPIKHSTLPELYNHLRKFPIFEFKGMLVFAKKSAQTNGWTPFAINFDLFNAIQKKDPTFRSQYENYTSLIGAIESTLEPELETVSTEMTRIDYSKFLVASSVSSISTSVSIQANTNSMSSSSSTSSASSNSSTSNTSSSTEAEVSSSEELVLIF